MKRITPVFVLICVLLAIAVTDSCKKDAVLPSLTTTSITEITINSAISGGNITSTGGADISARGVCYGTSSGPSISGPSTSDGSGGGSFTSNLTDLTPNTLYHVRAYATNKAGTGYGSEVTFTTAAIVVPTLTTTDVTAITLTTAVTGGNITANGGADITAKGVCWATTTGPTISSSLTADGTGTGSFVSNLASLLPSTTYYLRAYATNSAGTAYGNEVTFTTLGIVVPTLTTTAVTSVTLTSAISGGNITADGGGTVTARGTCWGTQLNPTIANSKTSDQTGIGSFISNISGLLPATTYHIRAYATNSAGTAYGNDISFLTGAVSVPVLTTTAVTGITLSSAISGGNITSNGGGAVTVSGICWATTTGPTVSSFKTTDGTLTGSFTSNLTSLTAATTYYVRAYATNSAGTGYGTEISFTTSLIVVPTLTTTAVTAITATTASSGGNISASGGANVTAKGVCWSLTPNPTISNALTSDGTGIGVFTSSITGLTAGATYHLRAYAINSAGPAYGSDVTFTTSAPVAATVTTTAATAITTTTVATGGNVTADGFSAVTAKGVCWSTSANPTISGSKTTDGTGIGTFVSNLTGLTAGTIYHVRAYATNGVTTSYGADVQFTTTAIGLATLTTTAGTSITAISAISGGNITSDGNGAVTARGVCWATTATPMLGVGNFTTDATGTGSFVSTIGGLTGGTVYYIRAYATNTAGTAYGNQQTILTKLADDDGNTYNTVVIGTQIWMAENLKTTKYFGGAAITRVSLDATWATLTTPGYDWFGDDVAAKPVYGALYNWFAVNGGNLCPTGWKVPADIDYRTLETFLGIPSDTVALYGWRGTVGRVGEKLKNTTGWDLVVNGVNGTNTSGFTALPGGYRYWFNGTFQGESMTSYWWTSTENTNDLTQAWYRQLSATQNLVYRGVVEKQAGKYVRCVKLP